MLQPRSIQSSLSLRDKIFSIDSVTLKFFEETQTFIQDQRNFGRWEWI